MTALTEVGLFPLLIAIQNRAPDESRFAVRIMARETFCDDGIATILKILGTDGDIIVVGRDEGVDEGKLNTVGLREGLNVSPMRLGEGVKERGCVDGCPLG